MTKKTRKKLKRMENDIRSVKHLLELVRTIIPVLVLSMRVLVENYGNVRIFKDRPYGYKRWIVEWKDGGTEIYSGIWYKEEQIKRKVEREIDKHR
jgi:hypothetical protein